jgi:hypothetical protein
MVVVGELMRLQEPHNMWLTRLFPRVAFAGFCAAVTEQQAAGVKHIRAFMLSTVTLECAELGC